MADYIEALRSAFRGGRVDYRGRVVHLRDFSLEQVPPPVPIYLAAMGPKLAPAARRSGLAEASGYPGQFARLGFASEVAYLERRFAAGASIGELLDEVPIELCQAAGYVGGTLGAAEAVARLVDGVDHVIIRIVTAGHTKTEEVMRALTPGNIRRELARGADAQKGATPDQTIVRPGANSTS